MAKLSDIERAVNHRVNELYEALLTENKVSGVTDFCQKAGLDRSNFSKYFKLDDTAKEVKTEAVVKLTNAFNVNPSWLLNGEGEPFKKKNEIVKTAQVEDFSSRHDKRLESQSIPLYDITAAAGLNALFNSTSDILGYIQIPNMPRCQGAIYVKGDSMYPLIKQGDMVAFQILMDIPGEIDFGEIYVIDMSTPYRERILVKYVKKSDLGDEYINLVSYNEKHHPDQPVHLSKVRAMAAVKGIARLL